VVKLLDSVFNYLFGWIFKFGDAAGILLISFFLSLVVILIYKKFTDQEVMKSLKQEIKEITNESKRIKDDPKRALELQKKAMEKNWEYMKHSLKPMLITMLPLLLLYGWLGNVYKDKGVILLGLNWIWIYIISSIIFNIILRKLLKVH